MITSVSSWNSVDQVLELVGDVCAERLFVQISYEPVPCASSTAHWAASGVELSVPRCEQVVLEGVVDHLPQSLFSVGQTPYPASVSCSNFKAGLGEVFASPALTIGNSSWAQTYFWEISARLPGKGNDCWSLELRCLHASICGQRMVVTSRWQGPRWGCGLLIASSLLFCVTSNSLPMPGLGAVSDHS